MSDISLYLDEDVRVLLAEVLRNRGYTVTHVLEVARNGMCDREQLAYAVKHKMTILTHNIKDYVVLSKSYVELGKNHFGIVVSDKLPFSELLRRTLKFMSFSNRKLIRNKLIWLQDYK
jgi:predicted nuclease of predicted toxin-antitoxin system